MNTYMTIKSYGSRSPKANKAVQDEVNRLEKIISTTITDSDVYIINNCEKESFEKKDLHPETVYLLNASKEYYGMTDKAFNPCLYPVIKEWGFTTGDYKVPSKNRIEELLRNTDFNKINMNDIQLQKQKGMQIDFGAVGKGYAGDRATAILKKYGIKSALLDFGGNIQTLGAKPDGNLWTVAVKNPFDSRPACSIKIKDKCVITSGGYERFFIGDDGKKYIHIFDGKTGYPVQNDLESVTIICNEGIYGDALSTSLFVMGKDKAIDFYKNKLDFDFVLITKDRSLIYSEGLAPVLTVIGQFDSVLTIQSK